MPIPIYLISISLPFITIIIVFALRYAGSVQQARARLANDGAYRQISEKVASAQAETAVSLSSIELALTDVKLRLASIEKILKEVG